jgi:hypothetical protein
MATMQGTTMSSVILTMAIVIGGQPPAVRTFDQDPAGRLPSDFAVAAVRQPSAGDWRIGRDGKNQFLRHAPDPGASGWSLAIAEGDPWPNVLVSARLRLTDGARAGGLVWRYRDADNFQAAVLDLDDQRISAYRVVDGHRVRFDVRDGLELDPGAWYTIKVVHEGARVLVWLGGIRVLTDEDSRHSRDQAGRAGVLAAGAGDTAFDDLRVERRGGSR